MMNDVQVSDLAEKSRDGFVIRLPVANTSSPGKGKEANTLPGQFPSFDDAMASKTVIQCPSK